MKKKYAPIIGLIVIVIIAIIVIVLAKNPQWFQPNQGTVLIDGMMLTNPYFSDKVLIIHSAGCPHCLVVVPILRDIEQKNNLTFYYYDVSIESQLNEVTKLNLVPQGVPTVIIYGKVYVGTRTKQEYETAILIK